MSDVIDRETAVQNRTISPALARAKRLLPYAPVTLVTACLAG